MDLKSGQGDLKYLDVSRVLTKTRLRCVCTNVLSLLTSNGSQQRH